MARISGLIISMPLMNSNSIPKMIKAILILCLTMVMAPVVPVVQTELDFTVLFWGIPSELCLGLLMGGAITIVFASLSVASGIISTQIGQAAAMQFNPTMSLSASPVGSLSMFLATAIFLGMDSHLIMIKLLAESFTPLPPNGVINPINGGLLWIDYSSMVFITGLKMAGPVLSLTLMVNSFVAIISKIAPTLNMFFSVGFITTMMVGMILFIFMIPHILALHQHLVDDSIIGLRQLFDLVGG
jgi:flagellar biosynthesis protein FliR